MASSSRALPLALLLAGLVLPGCWTGHLAELARRRESVVSYERAFVGAELLRLDYTVDVADHRGHSLRRDERSALVPLAELRSRPEIPLDEVEVEIRTRVGEPTGEPVTLLRGQPDAEPQPPLALRIKSSDGRDVGFELVARGSPDGLGHFRSGSLVRDRTALWFYPLVPFSVALDVAVIPVHVLGVGFLVVSPE